MTHSTKSEWLVPTGLLALSVVPVVAGTLRLLELLQGAQITPDNARYFAAPWPAVLHVVSVTIFCLAGAFQFAAGLRRRKPHWHRTAGRVLVPCGLVAALSGLWMTQFYPPVEHDGTTLHVTRLVVGVAMALFIGLGVAAIRRRDVRRHRVWMMRGYALGLGAGTQVLTHLPWVMFPGIRGELTRALLMGAGWAINIATVEWLLLRERRGRPS